jgi:hypothetical protein
MEIELNNSKNIFFKVQIYISIQIQFNYEVQQKWYGRVEFNLNRGNVIPKTTKSTNLKSNF